MAIFYYTPQGTVNAFTQKTVVRITHAVVPSAIYSDPVVFVTVKALFAKCLIFSVKMKAKMNYTNS